VPSFVYTSKNNDGLSRHNFDAVCFRKPTQEESSRSVEILKI
jgi:hypothetical protein